MLVSIYRCLKCCIVCAMHSKILAMTRGRSTGCCPIVCSCCLWRRHSMPAVSNHTVCIFCCLLDLVLPNSLSIDVPIACLIQCGVCGWFMSCYVCIASKSMGCLQSFRIFNEPPCFFANLRFYSHSNAYSKQEFFC